MSDLNTSCIQAGHQKVHLQVQLLCCLQEVPGHLQVSPDIGAMQVDCELTRHN